MYNGLIINKLLEERNIKKKDLVLAINGNNSTIESIINGNPTVKTLEKVADYFDVSMDIFFERTKPVINNNIGTVNGNWNRIQQSGQMNITEEQINSELSHLHTLLAEKEKMIEMLHSLLMNK